MFYRNVPFDKDELSAVLKFGAADLFREGDGESDKALQESVSETLMISFVEQRHRRNHFS